MLEGLTSLNLLKLAENSITVIEENGLSPLLNPGVQIILDKNPLTHLDGNMLKGGKKGTLQIHNIDSFGATVESPANTFNRSQYGNIDIYKCGINILKTNGMFAGAFTVERLNIVKCKINIIESFALKDMIKLKYLNLEENAITSLGTNTSSFAGLVQLLNVNLDLNKLTEFPEFPDSYNSILSMKLSYNKLYAIREGQFADYTSLKDLTLERNPIINVTNESWVGLDNVIHEASLTFPSSTVVPEKFYLYLTELRNVILNEVSFIPFLITSFLKAEKLTLYKFKGGSTQLTPDHLIGNTTTKTIQITDLLIDCDRYSLKYIPDETLSLLVKITNLTVVRCQMTTFPDLSLIATTLEYVDVSENKISFDTLAMNKLQALNNLKVLKLENCGMLDFLWEGMPNMPNLKVFNFTSMEILRNFTDYIKPPLILDDFQVSRNFNYNCTVDMCWIKLLEEQGFYPANPHIGVRDAIFPDGDTPCRAMDFPVKKQTSRYFKQPWGTIPKQCLCSGISN